MMPTNADPREPPILRGLCALQHASQHREVVLKRLAPFSFTPQDVSLEVAYWLARRDRSDELFCVAQVDA